MSKPVTVSILLTLIFFADLLSIQKTIYYWQNNNSYTEGFSFVPLLAAQISVAFALLSCGIFILYKTFMSKS